MQRGDFANILWVLASFAVIIASIVAMIDIHTTTPEYRHECRVICQSSDYIYIEVNEYSFGQVDCLCSSETVRFQIR
jgi:hypothetical protein